MIRFPYRVLVALVCLWLLAVASVALNAQSVSPASVQVAGEPVTLTASVDTGLSAKLDQILAAVKQPRVSCSVTAVGKYANGDAKLTVRCPGSFVVGPITVVR